MVEASRPPPRRLELAEQQEDQHDNGDDPEPSPALIAGSVERPASAYRGQDADQEKHENDEQNGSEHRGSPQLNAGFRGSHLDLAAFQVKIAAQVIA